MTEAEKNAENKLADEQRKQAGSMGENYTAQQLAATGYEILARNYAISDVGEIDIVAKKGNIIAFVEVKTRGEAPLYRPAMAVTREKQRRICKTALLYLKREQYTGLQPRFDIAEVLLGRQEGVLCVTNYQYLSNAFFAPSTLRFF